MMPGPSGRAAGTVYCPTRRAEPTIRPHAVLATCALLLASPETLSNLREIHHMLKDDLYVQLLVMLILLKNQYVLITRTTLTQGSQSTLAMPALWHL